MKTLTVTKARTNLGSLITSAANGEDIGILDSRTGRIIALRPVAVYSEDYALMEYGVTKDELTDWEKRANKEIKQAKTSGKLKPWK
jgi:antitoxin (DNA-binding transcriptional repressor) of toxin-antitoxin stability system